MSDCCDFNAGSLKGLSCNVAETDSGITITLTSDNKETVEQLKGKSKAIVACCCNCDDSK